LEKLYVFQLTEYDRVIVMDADGFPNNNLDHLFWLTMPAGTYIAGIESTVVL
jgi:alpha-N-acetylglucosamine transferase